MRRESTANRMAVGYAETERNRDRLPHFKLNPVTRVRVYGEQHQAGQPDHHIPDAGGAADQPSSVTAGHVDLAAVLLVVFFVFLLFGSARSPVRRKGPHPSSPSTSGSRGAPRKS